jgi:hypothetical protein
VGCVVLVAACGGEPTGPEGLSPAVRSALADAFIRSRSLARNGLSTIWPAVVEVATSTGTLTGPGTYDGLGVDVTYTLQFEGLPPITGAFAGVLAWSGLDAAAETVDELLVVGFTGDTIPESFDAFYWRRLPEAAFKTDQGSTEMRATFSGGEPADCGYSEPGYDITCTREFGTLSGYFSFTAAESGGTATHTQETTSFTRLPLVRFDISIVAR